MHNRPPNTEHDAGREEELKEDTAFNCEERKFDDWDDKVSDRQESFNNRRDNDASPSVHHHRHQWPFLVCVSSQKVRETKQCASFDQGCDMIPYDETVEATLALVSRENNQQLASNNIQYCSKLDERQLLLDTICQKEI